MATKLASHQLKDELVSWCIKVWKTNGTLIAFDKPVQKMVQLGPRGDDGEEKPDKETLLLSTSEGYLEVTLDDEPSAAGELLARRQKLDKFIRDHPEISVEIDPLLDTEIVDFSWIDPQETHHIQCMDRDEKVHHPVPRDPIGIACLQPVTTADLMSRTQIRLAAKYRLLQCKDVVDESTDVGAQEELGNRVT